MDENKFVKKQEQFAKVLFEVARYRNEMPVECVKLAERNLKLERLNAEKMVILKPKTDIKRFVSRYPLNKPLESVFSNVSEKTRLEDITFKLQKLNEKQQDIIEVSKCLNYY